MLKTQTLERTSLAEEKDKIQIIYLILSALVGFSLSQLNALGDISPFSVAFVSGISFEYCFSAFIGSAIGYFFSRPWQQALKYLFALIITAVFRLTVKRKFNTEDKPFVCASVAFCSVLCSSIAYMAFDSFSVWGVLTALIDSILSLAAVILFVRMLCVPVLSIGIKKLSAQNTACICFNFCILFLCASGFTIGSISSARIIAAVLVIFAAQYKGITVSSVAGICAGISFCLPENEHFMFAVFAFGGMVAGLFSPLGQYTTAFSFAITASIVAILGNLSNFEFFPIVEVIIAAAAYAVIPSHRINQLEEKIEQSGLLKDDTVERQVSASLERAAEKVGEVSTIVTRVSEKLDKVINPEIDKIFAKMQQNVCCACRKKSECWNKYFNETATDIMIIAGIQTGSISQTKLESRCVRPNALMKEIDKYYSDFVNSMASKMKVTEMRNIVGDQFASVSQFLSEIAAQSRSSRTPNASKARAIRTALNDADLFCSKLEYFTNCDGCVCVEVTLLEGLPETDLKKMKNLVEFTTARKFERPEIAICDLRTTVIFEEKASFKVLIGHSQIPFAKNKISGDCIGRAYDMNGGEIALISDGMGTGSRAAIDATMTTALMEKLLSCGFSFESALKMVNCALIVKSTDESLATVDGVCVNIYTGQTDFFKAGAAISFIRHDNIITLIEEASMPIGIIRNISPASRRVKLGAGDIILLVSDGVTTGSVNWIKDELLAWSTNSMHDLAAHIASLAKLRSNENNADDISVVALKLAKNE